jgi:hypothetical protein
MASETTTTSANDIVYSAIIEAAFIDYSWDWVVAQQFCRQFSLVGKPSSSLNIPILDSIMGTVGTNTTIDDGFNATEGTDESNTQRTTSYVTGSVSEVAIMSTLTDDIGEDSISGFDLMSKIIADMARVVTCVREDDMIALFASLSNSTSSTGTNLTVANALAAHVAIRTRGVRAPDGLVYVLHPTQVDDLEAALIAGNAAAAIYAGAVDRLLGVDRTANNGMGNGHVMNFRGYPVYISTMVDAVNTNADRNGAVFTPSSPANDAFATFSKISKRPFRIEMQRDASLRATEVVCSERSGFFETCDDSGQGIISDL